VRPRLINAECLATELLPCKRLTRRPNHFVMFGADGVGFRSASEPVRASLVHFFKPAAASESTMSSRCSMPPQPDQLRRRHDRHDNGERATPLDVPATQWNQGENSSMISRARVHARARGPKAIGGSSAATRLRAVTITTPWSRKRDTIDG